MSQSRKGKGAAGKRTLRRTSHPGNTRILLIESHPGVRHFFTLLLDKQGYPAIVFGNGIDALEWLVTEEPATVDLILLDWHLRDISSQKLCQHIRALAENHAVPIIALVDGDEAMQPQAPLQAGANAVLAKFAQPAQMRKIIRESLRLSRCLSSAEENGNGS